MFGAELFAYFLFLSNQFYHLHYFLKVFVKTSDRESWNSLSDLVNSFFDYYFFWNNSIMCKFLIRIQMLLTNSLLQGQRGREKIVFSESIPIFQKVKSTAIYRSWPLILNVCACLFTKRSNPTWLEYFANFLRIQAPQNTWVQWGFVSSCFYQIN